MDPNDPGGVGDDGGDVPAKPKRGPGRPKGSKTKPKTPGEPLTRGRLREAVGKAFSPEKLEKMLKLLSPVEAARLLASIEPRVREEPPGKFVLKIYGLKEGTTCPVCGWENGDLIPRKGKDDE